MENEYLPVTKKPILVAFLACALLSWVGIATAAAMLDEQLIEAATSGDLALVDILLSKGAEVNAKDPCGRTALMWAAKDLRPIAVKLLLDKGSDANAKDKYGETAFTWAIQLLNNDQMRQMEECCPVERKERECTVDLTRFYWASVQERADVVKLLQTQETNEALIVAAMQRDKKKVQQLLDAGADVRAKAPNGVTALMMAVEWGYEDKVGDVVQLLLEKGADINSQDIYGRTALTRAVLLDRIDVAKLLVDKGADINAVDKYGWTPVMFATHGSENSLRYLLAKGADPNMRAASGRTALMEAAQGADAHMVKQLLDSGADVNARTKMVKLRSC